MQRLKTKYPKIAERIILMALESVNYTEDRAMQILQIVEKEETSQTTQTQAQDDTSNKQQKSYRSQMHSLMDDENDEDR